MWIFLLWILIPGIWAVKGPMQVMVNHGSSLVVSCSYELYSKFWCQRGFLGLCTCIIQTDGLEVTVTQDGVSIKDCQASQSFTVTLDHVMLEDAGWYFCGVKRKIFSLKYSTKVMVSKAKGNDTSPTVATGFGDPPLLCQLSITYLLLILCVKVPVALLLVCVAVWVRRQCRNSGQENLQL